MQKIFDGHNDVLLRLWRNAEAGGDVVAEMVNGTTSGHIDLPRAKAGGLAGGLCAIYIPNDKPLALTPPDAKGGYATPLSPPLERQRSLDIAIAKAAIALKLERSGVWKLCRSTADIREAMDSDVFAAVLHMEGCEAIGGWSLCLTTSQKPFSVMCDRSIKMPRRLHSLTRAMPASVRPGPVSGSAG